MFKNIEYFMKKVLVTGSIGLIGKSLVNFLIGDHFDIEYFDDVLDNMGITYEYHQENKIPVGYQFFTLSDKEKWMSNWEPIWDLKRGITDYKNYLK